MRRWMAQGCGAMPSVHRPITSLASPPRMLHREARILVLDTPPCSLLENLQHKSLITLSRSERHNLLVDSRNQQVLLCRIPCFLKGNGDGKKKRKEKKNVVWLHGRIAAYINVLGHYIVVYFGQLGLVRK